MRGTVMGNPRDKHKRQQNHVVRGADLVIRDGTLDGALPGGSPRNGFPFRPYRWRGFAADPAAIVAGLHELLLAAAHEDEQEPPR